MLQNFSLSGLHASCLLSNPSPFIVAHKNTKQFTVFESLFSSSAGHILYSISCSSKTSLKRILFRNTLSTAVAFDHSSLNHQTITQTQRFTSSVNIDRCTFIDCTSTGGTGSQQNGGGLCVIGSNDIITTVSRSLFKNCRAEQGGGAFFADVDSTCVSRTEFDHCDLTQEQWGTSVYHALGGQVTFQNILARFGGQQRSILGSQLHIYGTDTDVANINVTDCNAMDDGGISLPGTRQNLKCRYVVTERVVAGQLIGISPLHRVEYCEYLVFINNNCKSALIWSRTTVAHSISNVYIAGYIPRFVTFINSQIHQTTIDNIMITFSSLPVQSYVTLTGQIQAGVPSLPTISMPALVLQQCWQTNPFTMTLPRLFYVGTILVQAASLLALSI